MDHVTLRVVEGLSKRKTRFTETTSRRLTIFPEICALNIFLLWDVVTRKLKKEKSSKAHSANHARPQRRKLQVTYLQQRRKHNAVDKFIS